VAAGEQLDESFMVENLAGFRPAENPTKARFPYSNRTRGLKFHNLFPRRAVIYAFTPWFYLTPRPWKGASSPHHDGDRKTGKGHRR